MNKITMFRRLSIALAMLMLTTSFGAVFAEDVALDGATPYVQTGDYIISGEGVSDGFEPADAGDGLEPKGMEAAHSDPSAGGESDTFNEVSTPPQADTEGVSVPEQTDDAPVADPVETDAEAQTEPEAHPSVAASDIQPVETDAETQAEPEADPSVTASDIQPVETAAETQAEPEAAGETDPSVTAPETDPVETEGTGETEPEGNPASDDAPQGDAEGLATESGDAASTPETDAAATPEVDAPAIEIHTTGDILALPSLPENAAGLLAAANGDPSILERYLSGDPKVYDNDLAIIAATLSQKAYNEKDLRSYLSGDLGFTDSAISTYNYSGSYAFSLATMDYLGDGMTDDTRILLIDARGSSTIKELVGDSLTFAREKYLGYRVYGIVNTFYKEIEKRLTSVMEPGHKYKILVTGHSLGGATANLVAAVLTHSGQKDVYCYTFGAIDPIKSKKPVTEGYENIHNVYNDFDTFSPTQYGGIMLNGAGSKWGKFGHIDDYAIDHRTESQKKAYRVTQVYNAVNHTVDRYVEDVKNNAVECKSDVEPLIIPEPAWDENDWLDYGDSDTDSDSHSDSEKPDDSTDNNTAMSSTDNVSADSDRAEALSASVSENNEAFDEYLEVYVQVTGGSIVYSHNKSDLNCPWAQVLSTSLIREKGGDHLLMIEIKNTSPGKSGAEGMSSAASNQTGAIRVGFSQIAINGRPLDREPFISEPFGYGRHMILTFNIERLLEEAAHQPIDFNVNDSITYTLHIYDEKGAELYSTQMVHVLDQSEVEELAQAEASPSFVLNDLQDE